MFDRIARHMKYVERAISGMSPNSAFAFALACTERQWLVFERASEGTPSMQSVGSKLRHGVDAAWEHVKYAIALPPGLAIGCRRETSQADDFMDASARTIANSIVDLLDAIERRDVTYAHRLSYRNFDLLELLLDERGVLLSDLRDEWVDYPSEIAQVRELVEQEMSQQNRDLETLSENSSSARLEEVRRTSAGKSLFAEARLP
jgi:hypothetical protein